MGCDLQGVEFGVNAIEGKQLLVRPALPDPPVMHDHDAVGILNGGQTVRDHDAGASLHQPGNGLLDQLLCMGINACGGFIQNQDGRVIGKGPGKGKQLPFSLSKGGPALGDGMLVFSAQAFNHRRGIDRLCSFLNLAV